MLLHRRNTNIDMENFGFQTSSTNWGRVILCVFHNFPHIYRTKKNHRMPWNARPAVLIAPCWHRWIAIAAASWACPYPVWATGPGVAGASWTSKGASRVAPGFLRFLLANVKGTGTSILDVCFFFQLRVKLDVEVTVQSSSQAVNSPDYGLS